jgi:hypothetical protein
MKLRALGQSRPVLDLYDAIQATRCYRIMGPRQRSDGHRHTAPVPLRVNPSFITKWFREHAEDIPKRTEGLRKAGFAEERTLSEHSQS